MSTKSKKSMAVIKKLEKLAGKKLNFGSLLWAIRQGEELSQSAFAEQLNVSRQYLCDVERGRRFVSVKAAAEFANILGYAPSQFVRICLQDAIDRDGLAFIVEIKAA